VIECLLYEKLKALRVRCNVCAIRCTIPDGRHGVCRTRRNRGGTLQTLIYERVISVSADPIEKKPVYHYLPGSKILSLGTLGCSFRCPGCQNWEISHADPGAAPRRLQRLSPEEAVELAVRSDCRGICWTYNEPSIWLEYTLAGAKAARSRGLATAFVTNGTATPEQLELIGPVLDVWRVDIKALSGEAHKSLTGIARFEPVLESTKLARHTYGMHVECVTNVTPGINDSDEMLRGIARWIRSELGPDTPWHVSRFYPHLDLSHIPPTPIETIERARDIGMEEGIRYVYVGNIPGHPGEDTYCHGCGRCVIRRSGFSIARTSLVEGRCPRCDTVIPGRITAAEAGSPQRRRER
jgi:pyruvate formate lyase activating enzyme